MGTSDGQPVESPPHQVRLSAFYIDQHEVTNRQFRIFLRESRYHGQPPGKWLTDEKVKAERENAPVAHVNFQDAESFAAWANKQLPTEAQWELAARSNDGRKYPWGDERDTVVAGPGIPPGRPRDVVSQKTSRPTVFLTWRAMCRNGPVTYLTPGIITCWQSRSPTTRPARLHAAAIPSTSFAGPPRIGP